MQKITSGTFAGLTSKEAHDLINKAKKKKKNVVELADQLRAEKDAAAEAEAKAEADAKAAAKPETPAEAESEPSDEHDEDE